MEVTRRIIKPSVEGWGSRGWEEGKQQPSPARGETPTQTHKETVFLWSKAYCSPTSNLTKTQGAQTVNNTYSWTHRSVT